MRVRIFASIISALLLITGCATSNVLIGKHFSSENVQQIVKGETTTSDLVALFGHPSYKGVLTADEEKWIYMYIESTAKAQSYLLIMNVQSTGTQKTLDILIKNGIVINYTFNEGPTAEFKVQ